MDERSGVVRTRGTEPFQLDMEYVLYVKAEDQNGRDGRRYQVEHPLVSCELIPSCRVSYANFSGQNSY